MRIVTPETVDDNALISSTLDNEYPDWDANETYDSGDRVVDGMDVYRSAQDSNTGNKPSETVGDDPPPWVRLGYSNRWRMFREGIDSTSTAEGEMTVRLDTDGVVSAVAVLGAAGQTVRAQLIDDTDGTVYDETRELQDVESETLFDYFYAPYETVTTAYFDNLPAYPGSELEVTVTAATETDPVAVGRLIYGLETDVGVAVVGSELSRKSYSIRERDEFGNLRNVPRRTIRVLDYDVDIEPDRVDSVDRLIDEIDGVPTLFVGNPDMPESIIFGLSVQFSVPLRGFAVSECNLKVEGF